jgi:hypothetical protein
VTIETHYTKTETRVRETDAPGCERAVRQLLARKVSSTHAALWLLVPAHLQLHTWDLVTAWSGPQATDCAPRLALQLVHEAALCVSGIREQRTLGHRGFDLLNGLPWIATDRSVHAMLDRHSVADALLLQRTLGQTRRSLGHYQGVTVALDPHHLPSATQREVVPGKAAPDAKAARTQQLFFALDADTAQPVACLLGSSAMTATDGARAVLDLVTAILPSGGLLLADMEHYTRALLAHCSTLDGWDLLVPAPKSAALQRTMQALPATAFTPLWAGYATATTAYQLQDGHTPLTLLVQRCGERPDAYTYHGFVTTCQTEQVWPLVQHFPDRWHIEEFFNREQALGWQRAGTLNQHIRFGRATLALIAQAAVHLTRTRLGPPYATWSAPHLADDLFSQVDGDVRVQRDTIVVTLYQAPHADRLHDAYAHSPEQLMAQGIDPRVPWLYNFKVDFRFK